MSNTGILVTGAAGFIGRGLVAALVSDSAQPVIAFDLRAVPAAERLAGVTYIAGDIRDAALADHLLQQRPRCVVHLASVVAAGGDEQRDYEIDVMGTENVLRGCVAAGVQQLVVTSSGAAYGYHPDNPVPLRESDTLRGNEDFAYARNKRLVEELLARWRTEHPELQQTVFRPCTVLGPGTANQITAMFRWPLVLGLTGTTTPFSLIADSDVIAALLKAACAGAPSGVFNLAGDGTLSLAQIAARLRKPYLAIPPALLKAALWLLNRLGTTKLGPQHVKFIQYRPVLDNTQLKNSFGYVPQLDAAAVFERYAKATGA
jgi:UDP-glucose 4-epimerase